MPTFQTSSKPNLPKKRALPVAPDHESKKTRDRLEAYHAKTKRAANRARHLLITTLAVSVPIGIFYQIAEPTMPRVTALSAYAAMAIMLVGIVAPFIRYAAIVHAYRTIDSF
jgi:hypothetical protein